MVFTYKIMTGNVKIELSEIFTMEKKTMRSHKYKIQKMKVTSNKSKNAFSNRVIEDWNALPSKIVTSKTTYDFKKNLDDN